jgi:dipeptidyl aminopeptidase/acylaminoacyl peptidase
LWWNEDDTIIYGLFFGDIMRVSAGGGNPEIMVKAKAGNLTYPQTLPDGRSILYTSNPYNAQPEIMVLSLKSGETKKLFPGSKAQYLSTGHIIYLLPDKNNLFAVPFDPDNLEVKGDAFPIHEGVRQYAVSRLGTFAYIPGTADAATVRQTMVWVNREGKEEPLSAPPNEYSFFRISPDGKRVALTVGAKPKEKIWIFDIDRGGMTCLTPDEDTDNSTPLWTPDGKRIVYSSSHGNLYLSEVYWRAADGTGEVEKLASAPGRGLQPFSLFGKNLVLWELTFDPPQADIGIVSLEADHIRKPLLSEKYNEFAPRISPDGRWMAYTSNESGQAEVYVRPFPDVNKSRENISTSGGDSPLWSPDGRELFYRSGDSVMAVRVKTEPTFQAEKPTVLFRRTYFGQPLTLWDIHPDGKRFLMLKETAKEAPRKINIVLNWFEELKQKLPDQ